MGLGNIGWSGLILILVALLLVFGPSKLPDIGKAFGKSLREFRTATKEMTSDIRESVQEDRAPQPAASDAPVVEPIVLKEEEQETQRQTKQG